ncbi:hypothetical protein EVAR_41754_1 [Eumeta japonica]|uniref:Uncharacterized protein n=1 Tax=Eumeta variegata TaxID=151549 RepID=A0A4C1VXZ5_EUMVA|nr:hypothetical protein EVAR_41754_1 [Eumeta japonica]
MRQYLWHIAPLDLRRCRRRRDRAPAEKINFTDRQSVPKTREFVHIRHTKNSKSKHRPAAPTGRPAASNLPSVRLKLSPETDSERRRLELFNSFNIYGDGHSIET